MCDKILKIMFAFAESDLSAINSSSKTVMSSMYAGELDMICVSYFEPFPSYILNGDIDFRYGTYMIRSVTRII